MTASGSNRAFRDFGRDIAVIILGILIALAVDGLVGERADRSLQRQYLSRLARDLRADSVAIATFKDQAAAGEQAAQELLGLLKDPARATTDTVLAFYFGNATRDAYLSPNSPTIQELQSTGNLRVIEDAATRDAVLSYYADVTRYQRMLETVMGRGKNPLGEVGWDIRAFDPAIHHAAVLDEALQGGDAPSRNPAAGQLLDRFRRHPDAERATTRAVTYNMMLQTILDLWQESLASTMTVVADRR